MNIDPPTAPPLDYQAVPVRANVGANDFAADLAALSKISVVDPCPGCGYARTGLRADNICPECGWEPRADEIIFTAEFMSRTTRWDWRILYQSAGGQFLLAALACLLIFSLLVGAMRILRIANMDGVVSGLIGGIVGGWGIRFLKRDAKTTAPAPHRGTFQFRISPRGFAVAIGFDDVAWQPWTPDMRIDISEILFGKCKLRVRQYGVVFASDKAKGYINIASEHCESLRRVCDHWIRASEWKTD